MGITLGIDLGTSSVKLLALGGRQPVLVTQRYRGEGFSRFFDACVSGLCQLGKSIPLHAIHAVGLSGQTGSYLVAESDGREVVQLSWQSVGRAQALRALLAAVPPDTFLRETGMAHPALASYPLPTIRVLKEHLLPGRMLMQPKDYLCKRLSGHALTDACSWRGLAHPNTGAYSAALLQNEGVGRGALPDIASQTAISREAAKLTGLKEGAPLFVGLNDFYASLVGIGPLSLGDAFDVTGTSEHIGVVVAGPLPARQVRSPFPGGHYVHYGVTASAGAALNWGRVVFGRAEPARQAHAPLFLPYLRGERSPVNDEDARGMFMGITPATSPEAMRYAVWEGVAFTLRHIMDELDAPKPARLCATGGAVHLPLLNMMKASLMDVPLTVPALSSGSAIGAAMLAGAAQPTGATQVKPDPALRDRMLKRYPAWKNMYRAWKSMTAGQDINALFGGM